MYELLFQVHDDGTQVDAYEEGILTGDLRGATEEQSISLSPDRNENGGNPCASIESEGKSGDKVSSRTYDHVNSGM